MLDESAPAEQSPGPALVGSIAPSAVDEDLTTVEAKYLGLVKADSDRVFQAGLVEIISAHGHNAQDGRNYQFVDNERGKLILRIAG